MSDNGPHQGGLGSTGGLRGRKSDIFEGGMFVPAIAWWLGKISRSVVADEILTVMDLLPSFVKLS